MLKQISHWIDYAAYFIRNASYKAAKKFYKDFNFVRQKKNMSSWALYTDILSSSIKYNMSPLEYFKLRFYDQSPAERSEYISARVLRKFQLKMNPVGDRDLVWDKRKFLAHFEGLTGRSWATYESLKSDKDLADKFLKAENGKLVVKDSMGEAGQQVRVIETKDFDANSLLKYMESNKFNMVEECVIQHDSLNKIAPNAVNTIRVITQLQNNGEVIIIDAFLKLSVHSHVDNLSSGGAAMPLDLQTGIVTNTGTYFDLSKEDMKVHPISGINVIGYQVPLWEEVVALVKKAARLTPKTRSIGWDIAVTNNGPVLIEGNHSWSHEVLQIPARKGYKKVIFQYWNT